MEEQDFDRLIFPGPRIGIMCRRNSLGEYISLKHLEKEKAYRDHTYRLEGFDGNIYSGPNYILYYCSLQESLFLYVNNLILTNF